MKWPALLCMFVLLTGCANPGLNPLVPDECNPACGQLTPQGHWQFVHRIAFSGQGMAGDCIGVTEVDGNTLRCALLTTEGMTLFAASEEAGQIRIQRALPPFDRPALARELLHAVRILFIHPAPDAASMQCGEDRKGNPICRYQDAHNWTVDLAPNPHPAYRDNKEDESRVYQAGRAPGFHIKKDGCFAIRAYDSTGRLQLSITARECLTASKQNYRLPKRLTLAAPKYVLDMTLLDSNHHPDTSGQ